jgi:hypothetical protein
MFATIPFTVWTFPSGPFVYCPGKWLNGHHLMWITKLLVVASKQYTAIGQTGTRNMQRALDLSTHYTTVARDMSAERGIQCAIPEGAFFVVVVDGFARGLARVSIYRRSREWIVYYPNQAVFLRSVKNVMGLH